MTNNTNIGIKKSNFTESSSIPNNATLDYVNNGQNFKITFNDFVAQAGLSLSLSQTGNPAGTPVLDVQGSNNLIRNLTGVNGVTTSIDGFNGIEVSTNFTFDNTGAPLVPNSAADTLAFKSVVGGSGVQVTDSSSAITLDVDTDGFSPANRVVVNQASDFPAAVGGFIPLAPNTEYYIGSKVTVANPFLLSGDTVVSGQIYISQITYNGSGDLFTGTDAGNLIIKNISFDFPNADMFNLVNTVQSTVLNVLSATIVSGNSLGSVTNILGSVFKLCAFLSLEDGFSEGGTSTGTLSVAEVGIVTTNTSFKGFDFGTNVYNSLEISNLQIFGPSGAFGISGLASSGNIAAGQIGSIQSCEFIGGITPLENIVSTDIRYQFSANGGIPDTFPDALLSLSNNATATTISTINTPVKASGTWVVERFAHFTGDTTGRATYIAERDTPFPITISVAIAPVSGTNKDMSVYAAVNGSEVSNSKISTRGDSGDPRTVTIVWQENLSENDYIELFVENNSDTTNLLVSDSVLRIL